MQPALALSATLAGLLLVSCAGKPALYATAEAIPAAVPDASPDSDAHWTPKIGLARQAMRRQIVDRNIPAVSVAVGSAAAPFPIWIESFGYSELEPRTPATPSTRFRIGGASTLFTAAAVAQLATQGELDLDKPLPRSPQAKTLRQALTSTVPNDEALSFHRCEQASAALAHLTSQPAHEWILLSAAVEAATKQPLSVYLKQKIFDPLGMSRTGTQSSAEENPERIGEPEEDAPIFTLVRNVLHLGNPDPRPSPLAVLYDPGLKVRQPRNLSCYAGEMAYYSTPTDMLRFTAKFPAPDDLDAKLHDIPVMSLRTIRDRGLTVVVMSNAANADTAALARSIVEAFSK